MRGITSIGGGSCALPLIVSAFYAHLEALHFFHKQREESKRYVGCLKESMIRMRGIDDDDRAGDDGSDGVEVTLVVRWDPTCKGHGSLSLPRHQEQISHCQAPTDRS